MRAAALALLLACLLACGDAFAWGEDGHSIVAEIAQRRLTSSAAAMVERLLGRGVSLASVSSWADDVRDERPETYRWHFVDVPLDASHYDARRDCGARKGGDCVVAELERLRSDLRCARTDEAKKEALRFAVHFVADVHQPLHTVGDARGGNDVEVELRFRDLKCRRNCRPEGMRKNLHAVWDETLIGSVAWNWGAYLERVERGWLASAEGKAAQDGGSPADWATQTHASAREVWAQPGAALDDAYYRRALPIVDRQLGLAGLRLARFLNEAYASTSCPRAD